MRMSGWHLHLMDANCVAVVTFTLNNPDADEWFTPCGSFVSIKSKAILILMFIIVFFNISTNW